MQGPLPALPDTGKAREAEHDTYDSPFARWSPLHLANVSPLHQPSPTSQEPEEPMLGIPRGLNFSSVSGMKRLPAGYREAVVPGRCWSAAWTVWRTQQVPRTLGTRLFFFLFHDCLFSTHAFGPHHSEAGPWLSLSGLSPLPLPASTVLLHLPCQLSLLGQKPPVNQRSKPHCDIHFRLGVEKHSFLGEERPSQVSAVSAVPRPPHPKPSARWCPGKRSRTWRDLVGNQE